ncbi:MAG: 50S ribosomal protein L30 [Culturomica sp.]|jgi:large subunit ribosomal protein L30|nr:50S ribosomal protein L30 [Culturomica sp.]
MEKVKVTLVRSKIGSTKRQIGTLTALGLNKTNSSAVHEVTPQIQGMINKVGHLLKTEEVK